MGEANGVTTVSVVVPVYSGEDYLEQLAQDVATLRQSWQDSGVPVALTELILVDDNARDRSPEIVDALTHKHDWIVALHLARNYGQHGATLGGILHTSGDWVVTMDEDLQHPPSRIPELLGRAVQKQADIAYGRPIAGVHGAKMRDWTSVAFKQVLQWLTRNPTLRDISSFRLIRGDVARSAASVAMHDTYFDVNLTWFTQRIITVPMDLQDERFRRTGKSGYRFRTLLSHAWRMLFSSSAGSVAAVDFVWIFSRCSCDFHGGRDSDVKVAIPEFDCSAGVAIASHHHQLFWRSDDVHAGNHPAIHLHSRAESSWQADIFCDRPIARRTTGAISRFLVL